MNTEEGAASESSEEEQPAEPSQNEQESESPQEEPGEEAPQEEQPDASSGEPQPVDIVGAGITQLIADSILDAEEEAEEEQRKETERKSVYDNIAIAQVDNFVNVRDAATEEGEVVGKLYNNSAATVEAEENGWYKITSGNVTGYVKSDFVVCGDENLAKQVSRRVATVDTETLFVRTEPTTESDVLEMVPDQEQLTVTDESVDGWTKVSVEKGDGYVSNDYVKMSTEFVTAESKAEEEARLAKEEAERKAAEKAGMGQPSRNRKLSCAGVIRLLIGTEVGSLVKELHRADIDVNPPPFHSAVHKSARRHSGTCSSDSTLLARIAETFAAIVCWRWMELLSTFHAIPVLLLSFKTRALQTATINCTLIRFLTCATRRFTTRLSSRSRRRTKLAR